MSAEASWDETYEDIIRRYLPLLGESASITADLALADQGLDSLATVDLLLDLEATYSVSIPDHLLSEELFRTAGTLWNGLSRTMNDATYTDSRASAGPLL